MISTMTSKHCVFCAVW